MRFFTLLSIVVMFFSCTKNSKVKSENKYSKQFLIQNKDGQPKIKTSNLQGSVLSELKLEKKHLPKKIVCLNTTYLAYFESLNALNKVVACVDLDRIPIKYPNIQNLSSANLDLEKIMSLQPDLIIASSFQEKEVAFFKNKYPVLIVNEFWESHPLGRAEWILAFGEVCGKTQEAKKVFSNVELRYLKTAKTLKQNSAKVLNASKYSESYFLPGCNSLIANFFKDAKIPFECTGKNSESIEISEENAFSYFKKSDLILFFDWHLQNRNYQSVIQEFGVAKQNLPIIYCNTFLSNYFQNSVLHPDVVLNELKNVVQNPSFKGQYFKRLNP